MPGWSLTAFAGFGFSVPMLTETNTSEAFGALIRNVTCRSGAIPGETIGSGRAPLVWQNAALATAASRKAERPNEVFNVALMRLR
jgi:hypothetical protein